MKLKSMEPRSYKFYKEDWTNKWFVDLPEWEGPKSELEMVCGADTMLDIIAQGNDVVHLRISDKPFTLTDTEPIETNAYTLTKIEDTPDIGGAKYLMKEWYGFEYNLEMWLCHVTEFVFGYLPETIYIA